jgi:hypothetical protein
MLRDTLGQKSMKAAEFYMRLSPKRREAYRNQLNQDGMQMNFDG